MSKKDNEKHRKLAILYPWRENYHSARGRCLNPNNISFKNYGGRGIEFHLTMEEVEELWFRDKAYLLDDPTINRKNNDGNYIFDNCEFIERRLNSSSKNKRTPSKPIIQYDLKGNFIKEWISASEAGRQLKMDSSCISKCCRKERKQTYNFIWRFKYEGNEN